MFFFIWMHSAMLTTSQLSTHYTSTKYDLSSYYHLILFCYTLMKICHIEIIKKLKGQEWSRHYLKMYRKTLICQRKLNTTTLYPFNLKFSYNLFHLAFRLRSNKFFHGNRKRQRAFLRIQVLLSKEYVRKSPNLKLRVNQNWWRRAISPSIN